jgi:hypothetical protein
VTHETGDVRQVIERAKRVLDRARRCSCGDCNSCATDKLLADMLAALTSQPAPSGWQQRIAAMEPFRSSPLASGYCLFCGRPKWGIYKDGHTKDCLWQNAVDALPPEPTKVRPLIFDPEHYPEDAAALNAERSRNEAEGD